ncbi:hypothetical protein XENOCAPTIV_009658 [Xenoophorus captivus]|uniref:C-type lectin domain-containing protein n=1 Tax=Xenoophorus captivus TaxID=1517983 RepID=A0ABV0QD33_9TELE
MGTHATGWKRWPGVGRMLKPSVRRRTPSCCTSETCEDKSVVFQIAEKRMVVLCLVLVYHLKPLRGDYSDPNMMSFMFHFSYEQSHFTVALTGRTGFWWMGLRAHGDSSGGELLQGNNGSKTEIKKSKLQPGKRLISCSSLMQLFHNVDWSQKKSWEAAYEDCISRGANLVSYSWSDGTPLSHTNWGHGEPNNHEDREDCVEMVSSTNGTISWWNDLNCDAHQDWICMISKGKTPTIPPVPPSPVPGWLRFKDKCFMFKGKKHEMKANWSHARSWCKDQGGDLAIIDNQYENGKPHGETLLQPAKKDKLVWLLILHFSPQDFVASYLKDLELPTWIGLSDLLVENQYAWSDGFSPVLYTNWNEHEPNNAGGAVRHVFER